MWWLAALMMLWLLLGVSIMTDKRNAMAEAVNLMGGVYAAADAAGISPAWFYKCLQRGYLPTQAAYRLLRACDWPVSRLAELTLPRGCE